MRRAWVVTCAVWLIGCSAQATNSPSTAAPQGAVVPGRLIVKLKPAAGQAIAAALAQRRSPTATDLAWWDTLATRYGLTAMEPVFPHALDPDELARKFPARAKRAPPDAKPEDLRFVYLLTLREDADLTQAVADYTAQPDVEYAQPDALIQLPPPDQPQ